MRRVGAAVLVLGFALAGCAAIKPAPPPPAAPDRLVLTPARFEDLPGWEDDHQELALAAFRKSCAQRLKFPDTAAVGPEAVGGHVADWRLPCQSADAIAVGDDAAARGFFEAWFQPYRAANNGASEGLFTGYYEPELRGARRRTGTYQTPLLHRPPDLVSVELVEFRPSLRGERVAGRVVDGRLKPYATRAEIEAGALDRYNLGFLWVDDPVGAFFLHVQGSGRIVLADGKVARVGYDGQNGQPYTSVGRLLVDRGLLDIESATLPGIRAWMAAHPGDAKALMDENASYVFFREMTEDGPVGSEGVVLTPGRSLAVDRAFLPLGIPIWLDVPLPEEPSGRLHRLLIAQDSGGAIRGPVRGDLFWGHGPEAEAGAGTMRARGSYYLLLPKSVTPAPATS